MYLLCIRVIPFVAVTSGIHVNSIVWHYACDENNELLNSWYKAVNLIFFYQILNEQSFQFLSLIVFYSVCVPSVSLWAWSFIACQSWQLFILQTIQLSIIMQLW